MATQFSLSFHSRQFLYLQISDLLEKVEAGVNLMAMSVRDLKSKPYPPQKPRADLEAKKTDATFEA